MCYLPYLGSVTKKLKWNFCFYNSCEHCFYEFIYLCIKLLCILLYYTNERKCPHKQITTRNSTFIDQSYGTDYKIDFPHRKNCVDNNIYFLLYIFFLNAFFEMGGGHISFILAINVEFLVTICCDKLYIAPYI